MSRIRKAKILHGIGTVLSCAWGAQIAFAILYGRPLFALIGVAGIMVALHCNRKNSKIISGH